MHRHDHQSARSHRFAAPRRLRVLSSITLIGLLAVTLGACGKVKTGEFGLITDRTIEAVATTGMIGDVVLNIGGDRVEVDVLMGAGVDPHLYKASENDLRTFERADVIFYNGLHLEGGLSYVLEEMESRTRTVAVTDRIPRDQLRSPPEFEGNYDPHVWFNVQYWMLAAEQVRDSFIAIDPDHRADYEARATVYLTQLAELDAYIIERAGTIPADRRVLITAHDAFGYFGDRYSFEVRGLQGVSTATEAGTRDVQNLADVIADRRIPAIFVESSVPRRTVEALREAVQSRGWDVQIGGELFSDAMGDAGTVEGTYIGMVRHNIDTITHALLGQPAGEES
ncbi:MAG: zinc ABC transporter substrate-binding protein [Thermomicrobiales bacterium]|nr:zinc ABC transporter substrate-binding protein [Thermomicrobiales bacterium]